MTRLLFILFFFQSNDNISLTATSVLGSDKLAPKSSILLIALALTPSPLLLTLSPNSTPMGLIGLLRSLHSQYVSKHPDEMIKWDSVCMSDCVWEWECLGVCGFESVCVGFSHHYFVYSKTLTWLVLSIILDIGIFVRERSDWVRRENLCEGGFWLGETGEKDTTAETVGCVRF